MTRNKDKGTRQPHFEGLRGEAHFIEWAASQGWPTYRGLDGHEPYDFIVDAEGTLLRVEVKRVSSMQESDRNYYYCLMTGIDRKKFDMLFVSTDQGWYWIPAEECPKTLSIKVQMPPEGYDRNINKPGKYEEFRVV